MVLWSILNFTLKMMYVIVLKLSHVLNPFEFELTKLFRHHILDLRVKLVEKRKIHP